MKIGIATAIVLACLQSSISVQQVRDAFFDSSAGKSSVFRFEELLDSVKENSAPVLLCYKGAAEMLKARNMINPLAKFSCFRRGRALIEAGVARDSTCLESHFIRFSIQRNLPGFLGYNRNVIQDSLLVANGLEYLKDLELKNKITEYFSRQNAVNKHGN